MTQDQLQVEINSITKQLIEKYGAKKVILFGSAAEGRFTPDSDVDFFIIKDDKRDFHNRLVNLYRIVQKRISADFIVYTPDEVTQRLKLGDPFLKSILTNGKVLYG